MRSDTFSAHLPNRLTLSAVVAWIYGMHPAAVFLTDLPSVNWFNRLFLSGIPTGRNHTEWCQENKVTINRNHRERTVFFDCPSPGKSCSVCLTYLLIPFLSALKWSRDNGGLWAGRLGFDSQQGTRNFSLPHSVNIGSQS
jgi:hypothetical protein